MEGTLQMVHEAQDDWELIDEELDSTTVVRDVRGCPWAPYPRCNT